MNKDTIINVEKQHYAHDFRDLFWCEKYRPKVLSEYIFHDQHQRMKMEEMIQKKEFPHILMSGVQGAGKTTAALILINELNINDNDVLTINASDENSVEVIRDRIKKFASSAPLGNFKVILLEEADYISLNGQGALRRIMEEFAETTRFILTCNYEHKLIPAIISRCTVKFRFKAPDRDDITEYLINVLAKENVVFDLNILDKYVAAGYPDIRSCLSTIQQYCINNVLQSPIGLSQTSDYKFKLIDLIEADKWVDARKIVCENVVKEEYEDLYRFLYENINRSKKFKKQDLWEEAIILISDYMYKHNFHADSEINAAALFIRLGAL